MQKKSKKRSELEGRANLDDAAVAEGAQKVVEEGSGFALFGAAEFAGEPDEFGEGFSKFRGRYGATLDNGDPTGKDENGITESVPAMTVPPTPLSAGAELRYN